MLPAVRIACMSSRRYCADNLINKVQPRASLNEEVAAAARLVMLCAPAGVLAQDVSVRISRNYEGVKGYQRVFRVMRAAEGSLTGIRLSTSRTTDSVCFMESIMPSSTNQAVRGQLLRKGRRLEVLTVLWNSAEGIVSVGMGVVAGSIALVGFGVDSFIETSSGLILLWRLQTDRDAADAERAEATALKLVGVSFVLLATYLLVDSVSALVAGAEPEASIPGIVLAALSLIVMPLLARAKRRVAADLNSRALAADSFQTDLCTYLSAILLGGLLLNAAFGWWWADPIAALAMIPLIIPEAREALRGERCGDCGACGTPACKCAH